MAALIGARSRDVVPVPNATTAVSAVISSVPLRRGDLLLMTSLTYPAVRALPPPPCAQRPGPAARHAADMRKPSGVVRA